MTKKILILTGDCAEDYEVKVSQQALQMLGYQVDITAPNKKPGDMIQLVVHDFTTLDTYIELTGHRIPVDVSINDINADDYVGLVVPGGRAPEYIRMHEDAVKVVKDFFAVDKPVAVVCHGLQLVAAANVLEGYRVTSYPACATECRLAGTDWQSEPVVVDRNLVTAMAWTVHPAWLRAFVEMLGAKITI